MIDLNDLAAIKKLDPQDTYGSTEKMGEQFETAWTEVNALMIPQELNDINSMVFCGMGASVYGALVVKALMGANFTYPVEIISDYHLPQYVNDRSLVVLTSYSGTTEEVLSCANEAKEKAANMLILTQRAPLAEFAKNNSVPAYIFDGSKNPSRVPRLGNGYSILGLMGLLNRAGILQIPGDTIDNALKFITSKKEEIKQRALKDVQQFVGKIPVIFAGEHLAGNAQIFRNQFNETSKTFSAHYLIPDLNHHLMEGLQFPQPSNLFFIVLSSKRYSPKIQKRTQLTIDVVKKNNQTVVEYVTMGNSIYEDFMEVVLYSSYLTLFLGLINNQNPAVNPWVDYFKKELK